MARNSKIEDNGKWFGVDKRITTWAASFLTFYIPVITAVFISGNTDYLWSGTPLLALYWVMLERQSDKKEDVTDWLLPSVISLAVGLGIAAALVVVGAAISPVALWGMMMGVLLLTFFTYLSWPD